LAGVSTNLDAGMYKASIGQEKSEHNSQYRDRQVSTDFAGLLNSNIRPFNVPTFIALELGEASKEKIANLKNEIQKSIGDGDFTKLQDAIERDALTKEQVEQMRDLISDEIDELLGPLQYLLFDIPFVSDVEDAIGDMLIGEELEESIQQAASKIELPSDTFEYSCER